jgi:hypothetical protein
MVIMKHILPALQEKFAAVTERRNFEKSGSDGI